MKKPILFVLMIVSFVTYSQEIKQDSIHKVTEQVPEYTEGGDDGFKMFVIKNFTPPDLNQSVSGSAIVTFVVEKDGSLSDIKVVRKVGYGIDEALIKAISKSKKWKPAIQEGKPVRVKYTIPIQINLQG